MRNLFSSGEKVNLLLDLIRNQIATDPFEYDGHKWAAKVQSWYCREVGCSAPTFRKLHRDCSKIQSKRIKDRERGQIVLLRLGDPDPVTAYAQAQRMSKDWSRKLRELRKHPKHSDAKRKPSTTNEEFRRMLRLAGKLWPTDRAPDLFRMVLGNWGTFKAGCKARHAEFEAETEADLEGLPFHHLPNIALMCKYSNVALEMATFPDTYGVADIGLKAPA